MRVERRIAINADRDAVWKIRSVPVGGQIEVVEFDESRDLTWVGVTGITLRGRIRRPAESSVTSPTGSPCVRSVAQWPKP
jgi:hypothetical protein